MESFEPLSKKFRPYDATTTTDTNNNNDNINIINNGNNMFLNVPPPAMPVFPGSFPAEHEAAQVFYQPNGGDLECRRYSTPEGCPYGTGCRFKHGPNDDRELSQPMLPSGGKIKPCMKFFSTSGCPYGERCHFLHYVPGGINSLGFAPLAMLPSPVMARAGRKQIVAGSDPSLTVNGYKTRLCSRYKTLEGCRFGEKCHFAHGESDFRPANNFCSNGRTMIKDPATQSTTEPAMQTTFGMPAVQSAPVMFDTGPVTYDYETSATFVNSTPFVTATTFADSTPFE